MIVANFASVPPGSICRPVSPYDGDSYYWGEKLFYAQCSLRWDVWDGSWQVDVRATKRLKGKKNDSRK